MITTMEVLQNPRAQAAQVVQIGQVAQFAQIAQLAQFAQIAQILVRIRHFPVLKILEISGEVADPQHEATPQGMALAQLAHLAHVAHLAQTSLA
jgi:hypothetical protein